MNHQGVPADTFETRLAIARFHAGGLSAREAAMRVGVSGQTWRNWENGHSDPARKPAMLAYIAQQLGVDADWLEHGGPLAAQTASGPGPDGGLDAPTSLDPRRPESMQATDIAYPQVTHLRAA